MKGMEKMSISKGSRGLAVICSLLILWIVVISSVQIVICWPGWFEHEYRKCEVLAALNGRMTMQDALDVTEEMLRYIDGDRKDLHIVTTISDRRVEFFTAREQRHLADCRKLWRLAKRLRLIAALLLVSIIGIPAVTRSKVIPEFLRFLSRSLAVLLALGGATAVFLSFHFDRAFIGFHHLLFDNSDWLLDPSVDNLINLLPERFFIDSAFRIGVAALVTGLLLCGVLRCIARRMPDGYRVAE